MNYVTFDTETTSLEKPFCYNIGYVIFDEYGNNLISREFVVEQIWHNLPLFSTAYYAEKRPLYISAMRAREIKLEKFGYICRQMARDFKDFDVKIAFAYNSSFDEKVFDFCCDWFKVINPFDNIEIADIRGFVHQYLIDDSYKSFCEQNGYFTETGNYSSTAETVYRYITNNTDFIEDHTALSDSMIELDILMRCIEKGADFNEAPTARRSIPRNTTKELTVKKNGENVLTTTYSRMTISKDRTEIKLYGGE